MREAGRLATHSRVVRGCSLAGVWQLADAVLVPVVVAAVRVRVADLSHVGRAAARERGAHLAAVVAAAVDHIERLHLRADAIPNLHPSADAHVVAADLEALAKPADD